MDRERHAEGGGRPSPGEGTGARAFVGVGSNIDPATHVESALERLSSNPGIVVTGISTFYRTPPLPPRFQSGGAPNWSDAAAWPDFLNGVLEVRTQLTPAALELALGEVESALGRARNGHPYSPRTIDLDLLLFLGPVAGEPDSCGRDATFMHPHPDIRSRAFVALPLLELCPDLRLPPDGAPLRTVVETFEGPGGTAELGFTEHLRSRFLSGGTP